MSPSELQLLKQVKEQIKTDLDDLTIMSRRKQKEFMQIELLIQMYDMDLTNMEKQVIDCVNIDENE